MLSPRHVIITFPHNYTHKSHLKTLTPPGSAPGFHLHKAPAGQPQGGHRPSRSAGEAGLGREARSELSLGWAGARLATAQGVTQGARVGVSQHRQMQAEPSKGHPWVQEHELWCAGTEPASDPEPEHNPGPNPRPSSGEATVPGSRRLSEGSPVPLPEVPLRDTVPIGGF